MAPETRHFNRILSAEAIWRGVRHAKQTVDDMIEGKYGMEIFPDIHSMNAVLEVECHHPQLAVAAIKWGNASSKRAS